MALREYEVLVDGMQTTLLLSDEDAKRIGVWAPVEVKPVEVKAAPKPANKSRTVKDKAK